MSLKQKKTPFSFVFLTSYFNNTLSWILRIVLFCLFTNSAYAQMDCKNIFKSPRPTLGLRGVKSNQEVKLSTDGESKSAKYLNSQSPAESIHRDPKLLESLIRNRKYETLKFIDKNGVQNFWFLSMSDNGRLYRMVVQKNSKNIVIDMYADKPYENVEKFYYIKVVEKLEVEEVRAFINLPRKGKRELIIPPTVLIKLAVKHDISVEQLIKALQNVPPKVEYRQNHTPHLEGSDSFLFFLDLGHRTPLEVVMLYDGKNYVLLTAFFPNVYRP